jgi:hypothetical protein
MATGQAGDSAAQPRPRTADTAASAPSTHAPGQPLAPQPYAQFRASHADRELVADRLREALDEGRLTLDEYDDRVKVAYAASTYDDLNTLLRDIPTQGGVLEIRPPSGRPLPAGPPSHPLRSPGPASKRPRRMPLALSILWTIWASLVGLNIVIWLIVMVTTGHAAYPWPIWVAGPPGAVLLAVTIGIQALRNRPDND